MQAGVGQRPKKSIKKKVRRLFLLKNFLDVALMVQKGQKIFGEILRWQVGGKCPPTKNFGGHFGPNRKCWEKSEHTII